MSTQEIIATGQSVGGGGSAKNNVDADAPASAEKSPNAERDGSVRAKNTATLGNSNTVDDSESSAAETQSLELEDCIKNTVAAMMNFDSEDTANQTNNSNSNVPFNNDQKNRKDQEPITSSANQIHSNVPNPNANNDALKTIHKSSEEVTEKQAVTTVDSHKIDFCSRTVTRSRTRSLSTVVSSLSGGIPKCGNGSTERGLTAAEAAQKRAVAVVDSQNVDSGNIPTTQSTRSLSSAASSLTGRVPKCDDGSTDKGLAGKVAEKGVTVVDSQKMDSGNKPQTRSRTRSLSSAASSLSVGESAWGNGGSVAAADPDDNDDMTPLRVNGRMSTTSQGPVRKLHGKTGQALLKKNNQSAELSTPSQEEGNATTPVSTGDTTLPPFKNSNEGILSSLLVTPANTRARSDTFESFRAAMDSQFNDLLPTESILLPEIEDPEIKEGGDDDDMNNLSSAKKVETIIGLSNNNNNINSNSSSPLILPSSRERSDTIDLLKDLEVIKEGEENVSNAKLMKITIELPNNNDNSSISDNPLLLPSPRGRGRSDTIDFLTSAVEFQVDDKDPTVVGDEMNPTPVNMMKTATTNDKVTTVMTTKKVEINLQIQEISSQSNGVVAGEKTTNNNEPKSQGNGTKAVAFGKTPKRTNCSRARSQSCEQLISSYGPLRKRYRTRSLSYALSGMGNSAPKPKAPPEKTEQDEPVAKSDIQDGANGDDVTDQSDTGSVSGRIRSNTLDSIHIALCGNRFRSDTMDFLTAAVAGDMGHDLDAAVAAAADDGASFAMHQVSAPSGASLRYSSSHHRAAPMPPPQQRPRSNTLDSTVSSINSDNLDFLVSVAVEQGALTSLVVAAGEGRERTESGGDSENSSDHPQRRPRSNTLEIYSNMNPVSRTRSDTVDFLTGEDDLMASARARSDTVDFLCGANDEDDHVGNLDDVVTLPEENGDENTEHNSNVMDHLKALCEEPKINGSKTARILRRKRLSSSDMTDGLTSANGTKPLEEGVSSPAHKKPRKNSEATCKTRFSQDSFMNSLNRNRLESWGGMSDMSMGGTMVALASTHTVLKDMGILDDVIAAAADLGGDNDLSAESGGGEGSRSLDHIRESRAASSSGGGDPNSASNGPAAVAAPTAPTAQKGTRTRLDSLASIMSLGELSESTPVSIVLKVDATKSQANKKAPKEGASVGTPSITVDYDAIAAAVNAATAATEGLDLAAILGERPTSKNRGAKRTQNPNNLHLSKSYPSQLVAPLPKSYTSQTATGLRKKAPPNLSLAALMPQIKSTTAPQRTVSGDPGKSQAPFPVTSINIPFVPIPKSTKTKEEMEAMQARARAAAGYVPPTLGGITTARTPPLRRINPGTPSSAAASKFNPHSNPPYHPGSATHNQVKKRGVLPHQNGHPPGTPTMPERIHSQHGQQKPLSHIRPGQQTYIRPAYANPPSALSSRVPSALLQTQQKWDEMFECLVQFIEETRAKCTKPLTDEQKAAWIWDGNVPTSYKTPCGKALGRWINNQRSAKAKGTLKDDREVRLVSTGLKWSVLTTNSWRQMLRELEIYVNEQTKNGRIWDGNVPTNHKIKSNAPTPVGINADPDEEKNLGRWVNRQRSLFQAGKLKKDRQRDLEQIGLKWSVLLTSSWSTMFESLKVYAEEKRKLSPHGMWDGNVPANFKTHTNPPLSLGRWVNRQRSAHAKSRLKEEYVKKLEVVGLKWVIHTRHVRTNEDVVDVTDDFEGGEFIEQSNNGNNLNQQKISTALLNGNLPTKQESSSIVLHPPLPPLPPPLGDSSTNNAQAPRINN